MERFADEAHLFSRAAERLLRDGHNSSTFKLGRVAVEQAKAKSSLAYVALNNHCATHNCSWSRRRTDRNLPGLHLMLNSQPPSGDIRLRRLYH